MQDSNVVALPNFRIEELTRDERLELIEALWDSLEASSNQVALTDEQRKELDFRIDEMDRDESLGIPWNEVVDQIRNRA